MAAHEVRARIELFATEDGGLKAPVAEESRSLHFLFEAGSYDLGGGEARFGAVVEGIDGSSEPGGTFEARLLFWVDSAARFATAGASFDVWYGRIVGHGSVLAVLPGC